MLKQCITKQLGKRKYIFQFEGQTLFDVLMESQTLSFPDIPKCGNCNSDNLILKAHKAQEKYEYVTVRCLKCNSYLNLGKCTDNKTYFLNPDSKGNFNWEKYEKD